MKKYTATSVNNQLADQNGNVNLTIPTRFSKNVDLGSGTNIFLKYDSVKDDMIPSNGGTGLIYPPGLDTINDMIPGDIIESTFIIENTVDPQTVTDYLLRFEFRQTSTEGGPALTYSSYNYEWNTAESASKIIKVIYRRHDPLSTYGYLTSFVVLVDSKLVYKTFNFYTWASADCRMLLSNQNIGPNTVTFNQYQSTTLFIPVANSLV